jgi:hypothetical protein
MRRNNERRRRARLVGDALREAGILIAVFGMLDKFLRDEGPSLAWTAAVLGAALLSFVLGIMFDERSR